MYGNNLKLFVVCGVHFGLRWRIQSVCIYIVAFDHSIELVTRKLDTSTDCSYPTAKDSIKSSWDLTVLWKAIQCMRIHGF